MHPIIQKTLGGLSPQYYFRQMFFGLVWAAITIYMFTNGGHASPPINTWFLIVANTLLYPYSRFVYESVVNFILGKNAFLVNAVVMLIAKLFTMMVCWSFAILVAPIGLVYLYFHHSRAERVQSN